MDVSTLDAIDYVRQCVADGLIDRDELIEAFNGSRSRMSQAMLKRRGLSVEQIRRLHFDHGLDASALLVPVGPCDVEELIELEKQEGAKGNRSLWQ